MKPKRMNFNELKNLINHCKKVGNPLEKKKPSHKDHDYGKILHDRPGPDDNCKAPESRPDTPTDLFKPEFHNVFFEEKAESEKYKKMYYQSKMEYLKEFLESDGQNEELDYGFILKDEMSKSKILLIDLLCSLTKKYKELESQLGILLKN